MRNSITAEEALRMSNEASAMDEIMIQIKNAASDGWYELRYQIANDVDVEQLRELGYKVKEEKDRTKNRMFSISWQ